MQFDLVFNIQISSQVPGNDEGEKFRPAGTDGPGGVLGATLRALAEQQPQFGGGGSGGRGPQEMGGGLLAA